MYFTMRSKNCKTIILSGPVGSGKSTALMDWIKSNAACGFVTPTVDNKKMLYNISTAAFHAYEIEEGEEEGISIGKYFLSRKAFLVADKIAANAIKSGCKCFVLDEVGKLELNEQGHYQSLLNLIKYFKGALLLVVREQLVNEVIQKFQLMDCVIITKDEINNYQL
jgi:nucleoside-triphosphatase THEP1